MIVRNYEAVNSKGPGKLFLMSIRQIVSYVTENWTHALLLVDNRHFIEETYPKVECSCETFCIPKWHKAKKQLQ